MEKQSQYTWDAKDWRDITPQCDIRPTQPTPYQKEIDVIIAAIQETPWMLYQVKKLVRRAEAERKEK